MSRPTLKPGMWVGYILPPHKKNSRTKQAKVVKRWFGKIVYAEQDIESITEGVDVCIRTNKDKELVTITLFWDRYQKVVEDYGWDLCKETDLVSLPYDDPYPLLEPSINVDEIADGDTEMNDPSSEPQNEDFIQRISCNPSFQSWLREFIQEEVTRQVGEASNKPIVQDDVRVILRTKEGKKALCAWLTKHPNQQHDEGADKCHFVPLEVFGDPSFKESHPLSTEALHDAKSYGICKTCHKMPTEKDNMFFDAKNRSGLCAICKLVPNTQIHSNASRLPLCNNCVDSTKGGKFDSDREKQFMQRLFAPVQRLFPNMDVSVYPEYVVQHKGQSKGAGNHDKRIDCLITMSYPQQVMGNTKQQTIAIIIELDKDQKRFTADDKEMDTIRTKVKHIQTTFKPSHLYIWRVNLTGTYKMRVTLEPSELDLYERAVILRKWVIHLIYEYTTLPKMMVWYMWYDGDQSKEEQLKSMYDAEDRPYVRVINYGPSTDSHEWKYCVDPVESGTSATFEKVDKKTVAVDKNPCRHMKTHHKAPSLIFGVLPTDKKYVLTTLVQKKIVQKK